MTWNYRILNHGDYFALHEVHYDKAGEPKGWTTDPIAFVCDPNEGPAGIGGSLEMALADARKHPVLEVCGADAHHKTDEHVLVETLRAIVNAETVSVHVGYDSGSGGGNYVYADAVRTDDEAFVKARALLTQYPEPRNGD